MEGVDEDTSSRAASAQQTSGNGYAAPRPRVRSHPALVPRTGLLERMIAAEEPVICVVAPAGYGKSALLTAYAERRGPGVARVACDQLADDEVAGHLARLLAEEPPPVAVVVDELDGLTDRSARESVAALARDLPTGCTLVVAAREQALLGAARLRVEAGLLEIGADDLALTRPEVAQLLAAEGVEVSPTALDQLARDTEGWPAAVYLAAVAARSGEVTADRPFTGTERLMSDYLHSEVLGPLSRTERRFLVRTSIVDQVSGPLADAMLGGSGASRTLERLTQRDVMLRSDDQREGWHRAHRLLRQLLVAELEAEGPDVAVGLHARASRWFEANDEPENAIDHAYLAGDAVRFGRLVLDAMQQVWASGQIDIVLRWMERLGSRSPAPHTPAMIAHGALIFALLGRPGDAERWAAVAESLPHSGVLPDGSTVEATLAYLRANLCRQGPAVMRADSLAALEGLSPTSPYRATMLHTEGLSYLLEGDLEHADASFAHAYDLAASLETSPLASLVLAEQFQVAAAREDWTTAESLVKRSLEVVARGPFDEYWTSALVFASASRAAAHRGDMAEARRHAARAARLRPLLTYALPVVSLQALVELARAYLALVDPEGARAVLEQIRAILQQRPDLGTLATTARELDQRVSQITAATPLGASSLTAAELRLIPLLPTHLTYPEIGERLFISRHTVKSHAGSVYRKLGASSRAEAVERIEELGLI